MIPGPVERVTPVDLTQSKDMPRTDELLISVRDFLRGDVMSETHGRTNFMARVASNSLDIVLRELALDETCRGLEHARLTTLLDADDELDTLRWRLVHGLRDGSIPLDLAGLSNHLRTTVVNQIAIDQPKYSGFKTSLDKNVE